MSHRRCRHGAQETTIGSQSSEKETSSTPQKTAQLLELSRVEGGLVPMTVVLETVQVSWFEVQYQDKTRYVKRPFEVEMNASGGVITAWTSWCVLAQAVGIVVK